MGSATGKNQHHLVAMGIVLGLVIASRPVAAQSVQPAAKVFTLQQAVDFALANYPAVRAALERYNAARSSIGLAKTSYAPTLNAVAQDDRGTRESVLGVLMPQFPTIMTGTEGTVSPNNGTYWVSGMGFLFSWEPFTFGYRRSLVRSAEVTASRTAAQVDLTRLGVSSAVVNASWLCWLTNSGSTLRKLTWRGERFLPDLSILWWTRTSVQVPTPPAPMRN